MLIRSSSFADVAGGGVGVESGCTCCCYCLCLWWSMVRVVTVGVVCGRPVLLYEEIVIQKTERER